MSFISLFGNTPEPEKPDTSQDSGESPGKPKSGFFDRMKQAVSRTRESLSSKIEGIVALTRTVDEAASGRARNGAAHQRHRRADHHPILDALRDRARRQAIEGGEELRDLLKDAAARHP